MEEPVKKVLLVDDDPRNIFALKAVLRSKGYTCLTAQSGRAALDLLDTEKEVGLVLLDMMMPDMDGYEAMAQLRKHDTGKTLPVVAVTARAMKGDREKCLDAGAADYVSKPVDMDVLEPILRKYLG